MMLHPYTYTLTAKHETTGEPRPIGRLSVIATVEAGTTCEDDVSAHWFVSTISVFELGADGVPTPRQFSVHSDDLLFDLILASLLRDEELAITRAWAAHLAGGTRRQTEAPQRAAMH